MQRCPGEANSITFGGEQDGRLSISDAASHSFPAERCTQLDPQYPIQCDVPARIRADVGDGDDRVVVDGETLTDVPPTDAAH